MTQIRVPCASCRRILAYVVALVRQRVALFFFLKRQHVAKAPVFCARSRQRVALLTLSLFICATRRCVSDLGPRQSRNRELQVRGDVGGLTFTDSMKAFLGFHEILGEIKKDSTEISKISKILLRLFISLRYAKTF